VLHPHRIGDAGFGQARELGERCMRPARAARQQRDQARDRGEPITGSYQKRYSSAPAGGPFSAANETQAWTGGAIQVEKSCRGTSEPRSILKFAFSRGPPALRVDKIRSEKINVTERRFVLVDFRYTSDVVGHIRLYEAGNTYDMPRALAHAATKRELCRTAARRLGAAEYPKTARGGDRIGAVGGRGGAEGSATPRIWNRRAGE
jgi:hypothetical protein